MKSLKDRIKESQDFYNGMAVGALVGSTGVLLLIFKGNLSPLVVKVEGN